MGIEAAAGFAHEAVIGSGTLHNTQALAGGIDLVQGGPNGCAVLERAQRISRAEHTGEPRLDLRQQIHGVLTATRPHPAHTGAVEIKGVLNPGQRGCQKNGMSPKQKPTTWMAACGQRALHQLTAAATSARI